MSTSSPVHMPVTNSWAITMANALTGDLGTRRPPSVARPVARWAGRWG
jgi:hypothetical protein